MSKKALSFFLVFLVLLGIFSTSFSVSAYDYNSESIDLDTADIRQSNANQSTIDVTDYSSSMVVEDYNWPDIPYKRIYNTNPSYYSTGYIKTTIVTAPFKINKNHSYTVNFKTRINANIYPNLQCYIYVYDGNGANYETIPLYVQNNLTAYEIITHEFDFCLDDYNLPSGYSLRFGLDYSVKPTQSYNFAICISDINYIDNDDSNGLLNTIISAIQVVWSKLCDVGNYITSGFSSLGSSIGNWFSNLGNNLSTWFSEQKAKIQSFNDNVGLWFSNLKDSIVDKLTYVRIEINNKLQEVSDNIKSFFIPHDTFFEEKNIEMTQFTNSHFGALVQAPTIAIDTMKKFLTIQPTSPIITLPAIKFNFQGKLIQLSNDIEYSFAWVNDSSHMVYYLYKFYRGFTYVILGFSFFEYCRKKYDTVFGGGVE